jgi:uncharacterized protein YkwD
MGNCLAGAACYYEREAEAFMRRIICLWAFMAGLGVVLGATAPASTQATPSPATAAATKPVDYYVLSADAFFKLPDVQTQIKKNSFDLPLLEAAIFQQSNRARADNKLPLFRHGLALNLMARRHSAEMADLQFFDHFSPTPANATLVLRLKNAGLVNVTAGENIAVLPAKEMGSGSYITHDPIDGNERLYDEATGKLIDYYTYKDLAEAVVTQWMNSPAHHEQMVNKAYVYLGVGVARGPYETAKQDSFYMTQNFCATITAATEDRAKIDLNKPVGAAAPAARRVP